MNKNSLENLARNYEERARDITVEDDGRGIAEREYLFGVAEGLRMAAGQ